MSSQIPGVQRSAWRRLQANWGKRLVRLWHPAVYMGVFLGFLAGRALPESQIGAIGIAFYVAVRGAGMAPFAALASGLAVLAGYWTALPPQQALWTTAALLGSHVLSTTLRVGSKSASPLAAAVVASTAVTLPALMLHTNTTLVSLVLWCGLTGMLALVFTLGILDILSGTLLRGGSTDTPVPAVVIFAAALCGLAGPPLWGWASLQDVAVSLVILLFATAGGPALGAAAAVVLGISFLLTSLGGTSLPGGIGPEVRAMAYVVAGLLGGMFRDLSRIGVGVTFFLGLVTYLLIEPNGLESFTVMAVSGGAAVLLYWAIPGHWLGPLSISVPNLGVGPLAEEAATAEPVRVSDRVRGMANVLRRLGRNFQSSPAEAQEKNRTQAFEQVTDRVCHTCGMYRHCWEAEFARTHLMFANLWAEVSEGGTLPTQPPPESLRENCIYPAEIAATLNHIYDMHRSKHRWGVQLEEARGIAGDYVRNTARILEQFAEEIQKPMPDESLPATLSLTSAVARIPKRGSQISGDSYTSVPLGETRQLLALSDGMGVGMRAAADSKQALQLFQELLNAGFATELAVNTVNSVLLLRTVEDSFVTIDLALLDLVSGRAEFVKVGAAPSFIKRGRDVMVIKQSSVPAGIVNQVEMEPEFRMLRPGDLLIMVTDGVWDVCTEAVDKERWLIEYLRKESGRDPESLAESILAQALELSPDAGDDMTVMVARLDSLRRAETVPDESPVREDGWVPAKLAPKGIPAGRTRNRKRR